MKRTRLIGLFLSLLMPLSAISDILPEAQQIAVHSYAWIGPYGPPSKDNQGFRMNLGFVVGKDAVAVIDSGYSSAMAKEMLTQIRRITDRPVRYVINTNSQPHRILGNSEFRKAGAEIIADQAAVARITAEGAAMARNAERIMELPAGSISPPGAPDRVLKDSMTLDLGDLDLRISSVGTAHTAGSLVVSVDKDKLVYAGDILYDGRLLAVLPVSRVDSWINAFDSLRQFKGYIFVPGHGNPGKLDDFEHPTYNYLTALKRHMDQAIDNGSDLQDAIKQFDQSSWQTLADFDALSGRNAHQTYIEREAAAFE